LSASALHLMSYYVKHFLSCVGNGGNIAGILLIAIFVTGCAAPKDIAVEERATIATKPVVVHRAGEKRRRTDSVPITSSSTAPSNSVRARPSGVSMELGTKGISHTVRSGDTLYSIAFVNQLSVDDLLCWNKIRDSRNLQIGQSLVLVRPPCQPACTKTSLASKSNVGTQPSSGSRSVSKPKPPRKVNAWYWPVDGKLLELYSKSARRQGVVIAASQNTPIKAAASGTVVYSGNALKGYGNLLILNHPGGYLSAYAHTQEILVKEGQYINVQDVIATTGRDNSDRSSLHFQIRKDGNPIDPIPLLKR